MIFLLLIFSQLGINLYANKDIFLIGEDILVRWEIVNNGKEIEYYESNAELVKLTNDGILRDSDEREIPHAKMSGMRLLTDSTLPVDTIMPGDTVRFQEVNLIGLFGSLGFAAAGFLNKYISPGEYYLSLFYYKGKAWNQKIYSDTLHLIVVEPAGVEKEAWALYKGYKAELNRGREKEMVEYGYELLTKYPESDYIDGLITNLSSDFKVSGKYENSRKNMATTARKIVDYLEKNVGKFQGRERALKETVNCITHGELMLGTPKEEVKNKVLQMKLPVSEDVMEVLEIKSEELDTKKN